jgi:hypothetical protein
VTRSPCARPLRKDAARIEKKKKRKRTLFGPPVRPTSTAKQSRSTQSSQPRGVLEPGAQRETARQTAVL